MHAVEDYVVSRYQMYMQVYFHPATRAMEVLLQNLLKRARTIYPDQKEYFQLTSPRLIPFFEEEVTIQDYLNLDDGVMNTYSKSGWIVRIPSCLILLSAILIGKSLNRLYLQKISEKT